MAKKRRAKSKRRYVSSRDRYGPTKETVDRLPVDPFPDWVKLGEANGGLEPQQVTALIEMADAFMSVTSRLAFKPMLFSWSAPAAPRDMSPAETKAWECWFAFAIAVERTLQPVAGEKRITGFHLAQFVAKRDRKTNSGTRADPRLASAANLWTTVCDDYAKGIDIRHAEYRPSVRRETSEAPARIRTWAPATAGL